MLATASLKSTLGWIPLASGSFRRSLDGLESFFVTLNDSSPVNEHWAISIDLHVGLPESLTTSDAELCLRNAWLALCHAHPSLTGCIEFDGPTQQTFVVTPLVTEEDNLSWLSHTFFVQHDNFREMSSTTNAVSKHHPFTILRNTGCPTCHWLPASQELHIRCQHWRIDGIGMLMLANSFMLALASVMSFATNTFPDGPTDRKEVDVPGITPCLYDIIGSNLGEAETPIEYKDAADGLVANFVQGVPSIGLPTKQGSENLAPSDTARELVVLSVAQTEAVIAACKARLISVASAVHAALIRVTAKYPQHPLAQSYACFFPIDMRRHLPNPPEDGEFVVNNFCSGLPICVSGVLPDGEGALGKSFDSIAAEIGAVYACDLARPRKVHIEDHITMLKLVPPYLRRTTQLFAASPPPEFPLIQTPDLSTLGKIEEYIKSVYTYGSDCEDKLEVLNFNLGTQMMTRQLQCHVWTFRNRLSVQGCFNTSFYERAFVASFLDMVQTELLQGLSIM